MQDFISKFNSSRLFCDKSCWELSSLEEWCQELPWQKEPIFFSELYLSLEGLRLWILQLVRLRLQRSHLPQYINSNQLNIAFYKKLIVNYLKMICCMLLHFKWIDYINHKLSYLSLFEHILIHILDTHFQFVSYN